MAPVRGANRMGDGRTIRRGDAPWAQQGHTANARGAAGLPVADGLVGSPAPSPAAAHAGDGAGLSASTASPTIPGEPRLAFGVRRLLGALGVRSSEEARGARRGEQARVWLWQPTGGTLSSPCSMDGRAEPARAETNRVPPARDGRLVPPPRDDWRGD